MAVRRTLGRCGQLSVPKKQDVIDRTSYYSPVAPPRKGRACSVNFGHQSIGGFFPVRRAMPKQTREPFAAGGLDDPAKQFREFAAECLELGRDIASPEKRRMYLKMARVWYQMARRWEKRLQPGRPSRRHQSFE